MAQLNVRRISLRSTAWLAVVAAICGFACTMHDKSTVQATEAPDAPVQPHSVASDDAVLSRLDDYTNWQVVNPSRYRQERWMTRLCVPRPSSGLTLGERCHIFERTTLRNNPVPRNYVERPVTEPIDVASRSSNYGTGGRSVAINLDPLPPGAGIHVFVNPPAEAPMLTQKQPHFPEGSIIVKQKWHDEEQAIPELLTVMIKREAGYNPDVGDWEFLAISGDATRIEARGRLDNCQSCHIPRASTDFVVRSYLPNDILSALD